MSTEGHEGPLRTSFLSTKDHEGPRRTSFLSTKGHEGPQRTSFLSTKGHEGPLRTSFLSTKGHEGPLRTSFFPRRATKGHEENHLWSTHIMVVDHENHLRNGPILPVGVLSFCYIVSSLLQMTTEPSQCPGGGRMRSDDSFGSVAFPAAPNRPVIGGELAAGHQRSAGRRLFARKNTASVARAARVPCTETAKRGPAVSASEPVTSSPGRPIP